MRLRTLFYVINSFVISGFIVVTLSGCDFIKSMTGGGQQTKKPTATISATPANGEITTSTEGNASGTPAHPTPPVVKCSNGSAPVVLSGDCKGEWKATRQGKNLVCEFKWGPTINCPAGTKPTGIPAVCYGSTIRPLGDKQSASTSEKCEELFGKYPQSPKYDLNCCKE